MCIRDRCLHRIYISGQPLTIITDNKALTFIQKCHLNNTRITRWILSIQEYNFEILDCKGKENIVADTLSRYTEDHDNNEITEDKYEYYINGIEVKLNKNIANKLRNINQIQMTNEKLKEIVKKVQEGDDDRMKLHYKVISNKLYRKWKNNWKLYIPKEFQIELIKEIHQIYGHTRTKKTVQLVKEYFTMDLMSQTISRVIKYCDVCQKCKDNGNKLITCLLYTSRCV